MLTKKRLRHLYDQIDDDSTSMKACLLTLCLYPDRAVVSEAIALLMQFAEGTKRIIRVAKLTRVVSVEGNYENFQHVSERAPCLHLWLYLHECVLAVSYFVMVNVSHVCSQIIECNREILNMVEAFETWGRLSDPV